MAFEIIKNYKNNGNKRYNISNNLISSKESLAFINIHKNAGTSICSWLLENSEEIIDCKLNLSLSQMRKEYDFDKSFAVVRNPWDRAFSSYCYQKLHSDEPEIKKILLENKIYPIPDFEYCIKNFENFSKILKQIDNTWNNIFTNQVEWIKGGVDFVLKFENLDEDFKIIQNIFNCDKPLKKLNSSFRSRNYRNYYNNTTKDIISELFQEDIKFFDYSF